ncbi:MAG: thioredoxin domain-containing protein [Alphaproteobacteria bacterium]|nr:thioredoxin domain-containing protein [Alphaproteobacteria bacterium]
MTRLFFIFFCVFFTTTLRAEEPKQIHQIAYGQDNAPEEMLEYTSLTCQHCANFHLYVLPLVQNKYIYTGKLKLIIRPLAMDKDSLMAFKILYSLPADQQDAAMTKIFSSQRHWIGKPPEVLGRLLGLTPEQTKAAMENKQVEEGLLVSAYNAQTLYDIDSAPTFYIHGKKVEGAPTFEDFQTTFESIQNLQKDSKPTTRMN